MTQPEGLTDEWKKSSYTGGENCVEARLSDAVEVRDTKDREGPSLSFSLASWAGLIASAESGKLDR